jgi:hypothetical protein
MTGHVPAPPTESLTGRWTIERAVDNGVADVPLPGRQAVQLRTWGLTIRHAEHQVVEVVLYRADPRTIFRTGQEITGRIVTTREGDMFRRDRPQVGRRGG